MSRSMCSPSSSSGSRHHSDHWNRTELFLPVSSLTGHSTVFTGGNEDNDSPPFNLRRLNRSPRDILLKKADLESVTEIREQKQERPRDREVDEETISDDLLEREISLRLFYIQKIGDLRSERVAQELVSYYQRMDSRLHQARGELNRVISLKCELDNKVKVVKQDQECLKFLIQSNDDLTLQSLSILQHKLKKSELKLKDLGLRAGIDVPRGNFNKVFPPPAPSMLDWSPIIIPDMSKPPPIREKLRPLPDFVPSDFHNPMSFSHQLSPINPKDFDWKFSPEFLPVMTKAEL